jgi:hypothetical protein
MAYIVKDRAGGQYLRLEPDDHIGTIYCSGCGTSILTPKQKAEVFPLCSRCLVAVEDDRA